MIYVKRILRDLFLLMVMTLAVVVPFASFLDTYEISFSFSFLIIIAIAACGLFSFCANRRSTTIVMLVVLVLGIAGIFYFYTRELRDGILSMANQVIQTASEYFDKKYQLYELSDELTRAHNISWCETLVIGIIVVELSFFAMLGTWYKISAFVHGVIFSIFVGIQLMLGLMPSPAYMICICIYLTIICMCAGRNMKGEAEERLSFGKLSTVLYLMILCGLVTLPTVLLVKQREYEEFRKEQDFQEYVNKKVDSLSDSDWWRVVRGLPKKKTGTAGMSGGKLGLVDELEMTDEPVMKLSLDSDASGIYLRGYYGVHYKGDHWTGYYDRENTLYDEGRMRTQIYSNEYNTMYYEGMTAMMASEEYRDLEDGIYGPGEMLVAQYLLKTIPIAILKQGESSHYTFAPYYSYGYTTASENRDAMYVAEDDSDYGLNYLEMNFNDGYNGIQGLLNVNDLEYTNFLVDVLLDSWQDEVNENTEEYLENFARENRFDGSNYDEVIQAVQEEFRKNYSYSLKPGSLGTDEDFLEKFLLKEKKGYCVYFASSATMMFRACGIPARYVEGYRVTERDMIVNRVGEPFNRQVSNLLEYTTEKRERIDVQVLARNAHAWTEIYINGFGWVPVEVTPGYSGSVTGGTGEQKETESSVKETMSTTQKEITTKQNSETTKKLMGSTTETKGTEKKQNRNINLGVLGWIFGGMLLAVLVALGVIMVQNTIRNRRVRQYQSLSLRNKILYIGGILEEAFALMELPYYKLDKKEVQAEKLAEVLGKNEAIYEVLELLEKAKYAGEEEKFSEEEFAEIYAFAMSILETASNMKEWRRKHRIQHRMAIIQK